MAYGWPAGTVFKRIDLDVEDRSCPAGSFSFRRGGCTTGPKQVKGFCSPWGPACLARPA